MRARHTIVTSYTENLLLITKLQNVLEELTHRDKAPAVNPPLPALAFLSS